MMHETTFTTALKTRQNAVYEYEIYGFTS